MAVLDKNGKVEGLLDESDVLVAMTRHQAAASTAVSDHMTTKLETIDPDGSLDDVLKILENDKVAIVADNDNFYGLVTRIDVINFLRKQLP
jgi:cystathionine beta-synthase